MTIIGTFTQAKNGSFKGSITTLGVQASDVRIVAAPESSSDKAPTHRLMLGDVEVGAGWRKTSTAGRPYIAFKLDDPSFAAPAYANLFEDEDASRFSLIWSR